MTGWKHRENFKAYYQTFAQGWEQEQQAKEMQKQMQMMQQMQNGNSGMGPPPDHFQQQMAPPFGVPGQMFPPQHLMGMPPPNMMMGQQWPPQHAMGMPSNSHPNPNMMSQPMPQGPGGPPPGSHGSAPPGQFRPPPMFQPPPLFPQQMQVASAIIQSESKTASDSGSQAAQ